MKAIPNALDKAKELVKEFPYLFNQDPKYAVILETVLAKAILEYSIECDKANMEPET